MAPPVLNPMVAHAARDKLPRKTAVWRPKRQPEKNFDEAKAQAEEKNKEL